MSAVRTGSSLLRSSSAQELLTLVRRDPQRVVVLQLEDQISRLVGQGSHAPFAMTSRHRPGR